MDIYTYDGTLTMHWGAVPMFFALAALLTIIWGKPPS